MERTNEVPEEKWKYNQTTTTKDHIISSHSILDDDTQQFTHPIRYHHGILHLNLEVMRRSQSASPIWHVV